MNRIDPFLLHKTEKVFRANFYYSALENKPKDKIYAVDLQGSSKTLFTRHLVAGRKKHGAIKFMAELEKSAMLA